MSLINPVLIIDLLNTVWFITIFIVVFCLIPTKISSLNFLQWQASQAFPTSTNNYSGWKKKHLVGSFLRFLFSLILGTIGLSYLNLLNWLTLILFYSTCIIINYLASCNWQLKQAKLAIQSKLFDLIDTLDQGVSLQKTWQSLCHYFQLIKQKTYDYLNTLINHQGIAFVVFLTMILGFSLLLRWEYPLTELRFSHPENYNNLLIAQELVSNNYPDIDYLPVFSALAGALSILSSIDTMQGVRFLSPILGILLVLSVGYLVSVLCNNVTSALVAMFALGIYLFTWEYTFDSALPIWLINIFDSLNNSLIRQWTGNGLEIGVISLLLGLGYFFDDQYTSHPNVFKINVSCSILLLAISTPSLLILLVIAPIGVLGGKKSALVGITITWIILAIFGSMTQGELLWTQSFLMTLPIALSLLIGFLFGAIAQAGKVFSEKWADTFCLALVLALSFNFLLPTTPKITYVEYDITARKTLEIKHLFSRNTWTVAAPAEQLSEIYGSGWYEDLALFVDKYQDQASDPDFNFPLNNTDLFVYVEKIPFVTFSDEPATLTDSILGDRTYRHYRSTAGRASLEFGALQMCEAYRQNHLNSKIYFENEELRIYQFKSA